MKSFKSIQPHTKMYLFFLSVFLLLIPFTHYAQNRYMSPFPKTETHALLANANGKEYRLFVSLPESYNENDTIRYPVLYLLDGNPFFSLLQSMQHFFVTGEEMPEMIVVGIGYPVKNVLESMPYRTRDYTPTRDTAFETMINSDLKLPVPTKSGEADAFLKTLKQDIFPLIEKRYKTRRGRGFAGHSFGALFGAYVLFHEPGVFNKYLLSSISMPWDKDEMLQEEQQFYKLGNRNLTARVFISVGSREENGMQPLMHQLVASMRTHAYKGLELKAVVLKDETHTSAVTTAFNQGLRDLYCKPTK
jgi:uncharacterized protein